MVASSYLLGDLLGGGTSGGRELFDLCSVVRRRRFLSSGSMSWWSGTGTPSRASGNFLAPTGGEKADGVVLYAVARDMPGPGMDSPVSLLSLFVLGVHMPLVGRLLLRWCG